MRAPVIGVVGARDEPEPLELELPVTVGVSTPSRSASSVTRGGVPSARSSWRATTRRHGRAARPPPGGSFSWSLAWCTDWAIDERPVSICSVDGASEGARERPGEVACGTQLI